MDQNAQQSVVDRLQQATNVLVTVSNNPSVDQLAACIGLTLLLNKVGKHGTAVFSGKVPSTIEFLKPETTIEKNTDSLQDFIIALDKSKADKLRYKVEDQMVKIFITPYRTNLTQKDLEFSQGDFNVDVVVALGVHERADLDQAIVAHGRILHDATIISVNNKEQSSLGTLNWVEPTASSLSEMAVELGRSLGADKFDAQISTAFMTGIVAETERFSNSKTNPRTMTLASELMTAGANQQLIAAKLQEPATTSIAKADKDETSADGSLQIAHADAKPDKPQQEPLPKPALDSLPPVVDETPTKPTITPSRSLSDDISLSSEGSSEGPSEPTPPVTSQPATTPQPAATLPGRSSMVMQPPTMGGNLTANSRPEALDPSTDPLSSTASTPAPILSHTAPTQDLDTARQAVNQAILNDSSRPLDPIAALNAQPVDLNLGNPAAPGPSETSPAPVAPIVPPIAPAPLPPAMAQPPAFGTAVNPNLPPSLVPNTPPVDATASNATNPTAPPPVPPPMLVPTDNSKPGTL